VNSAQVKVWVRGGLVKGQQQNYRRLLLHDSDKDVGHRLGRTFFHFYFLFTRIFLLEVRVRF
jgi:hypothetical protein